MDEKTKQDVKNIIKEDRKARVEAINQKKVELQAQIEEEAKENENVEEIISENVEANEDLVVPTVEVKEDTIITNDNIINEETKEGDMANEEE